MLLPLRLGGVLDDRLLAVDDVLLQLVAQHALDRLALVGLGDLLNGVRDGVGLEIEGSVLFPGSTKIYLERNYSNYRSD